MISQKIFDKNRTKQRIKLALKVLGVMIIITSIALGGFYYYQNYIVEPKNNQEEDENQSISKKSLIICFDPDLQTDIISQVEAWEPKQETLDKYEILYKTYTDTQFDCTIHIARNITQDTRFLKIWSKIYVPVSRFDAPIFELTAVENQLENGIANQSIDQLSVIWDPETEDFLNSKFGDVLGQQYLDIEQIHKELQADNSSIAIIPFDQIKPYYKVLPIDGNYPYRDDFNERVYQLSDTVWVKTSEDIESELSEEINSIILNAAGDTNYVRENIKDLIITGSSAIGARSQHPDVSLHQDPLFPILGLADTLRSADLTHISNESSFAPNCIQYSNSSLFCGVIDSFDMLTYAGVDIVGLSGNHILDAGRDNFRDTLQLLYYQNDIKYFGAGLDFDSAHTPLVMDLGANKIAFLGYNFIGPNSYYATTTLSGSSSPDQYYGDGAQLAKDIKEASQLADYVFVDMQWGLPYTHTQNQAQSIYGKLAIDSGADIVTGVHPNYVQGIEYYKDGIIFYGLGSFLIDDFADQAAREGMFVKHIFYDGKYLGYELATVYMQDNIQLVATESDKRDQILDKVFDNSNFNPGTNDE